MSLSARVYLSFWLTFFSLVLSFQLEKKDEVVIRSKFPFRAESCRIHHLHLPEKVNTLSTWQSEWFSSSTSVIYFPVLALAIHSIVRVSIELANSLVSGKMLGKSKEMIVASLCIWQSLRTPDKSYRIIGIGNSRSSLYPPLSLNQHIENLVYWQV